jgi:hypothetical protein
LSSSAPPAGQDCWFRIFECMVGTVKTSVFNAFCYFEGLAWNIGGSPRCWCTAGAPASTGKHKGMHHADTTEHEEVNHTILKLALTAQGQAGKVCWQALHTNHREQLLHHLQAALFLKFYCKSCSSMRVV